MPTCPHCGHEADAPARECPLCGTPLSADADGPGGRRGGPRADAFTEEAGDPAGPVPWEDPEATFFGALLRTWVLCLFEPERFFAAIDREGALARPLLYFLVVAAVFGFFSLLWQTVIQTTIGLPMAGRGEAELLLSFFITPFAFLLFLVVGGTAVHLGARLLGQGPRSVKATYRVLCYAVSPLLLTVVPVVGNLVAPGWSLVVVVLGIRETHRLNTGRAVIAVLAPLAFFVLGLLFLLVVAFSGSEVSELYGPRM